VKGGPGSGFHGHSGRPGEVGGSTSSGVRVPKGIDDDIAYQYARFVLNHKPGDAMPADLGNIDDKVFGVMQPNETLGQWAAETIDKVTINKLISDSNGILNESDRAFLEDISNKTRWGQFPAFSNPYKVVMEDIPKNVSDSANLGEWGISEYSIRPTNLSAVGWWDLKSGGWEIHIAKNSPDFGISHREVFWHEFGHTLTNDIIKRYIGDPLPNELAGDYTDRFAQFANNYSTKEMLPASLVKQVKKRIVVRKKEAKCSNC
jgi:hypothetical protein